MGLSEPHSRTQNQQKSYFCHPPYSPYLTPPDFNLFGAPKDAVSGVKFDTDDDVIGAVSKTRHAHTLVPRWRKAVEVEGNFLEKLGMETKNHSSLHAVFIM
jgi:hypothetical protein